MSENIRLVGTKQEIEQALLTILNIREQIENRDIGDFVGIPLEEYVKAKPHTIKLTIFYSSNPLPPFRSRRGEKVVTPIYNVPDVNRGLLNWENIKRLAGTGNGYMWGRFRAIANLDNGRQMQVYGGSERAAETRLKELLQLSTAKILTLTVSEEKREGKRAQGMLMEKRNTRVYPIYFTVISTKKVQDETTRQYRKIATTQGAFIRQHTPKIPLWVDREPSNAKDLIRESLRNRGVDDNSP